MQLIICNRHILTTKRKLKLITHPLLVKMRPELELVYGRVQLVLKQSETAEVEFSLKEYVLGGKT